MTIPITQSPSSVEDERDRIPAALLDENGIYYPDSDFQPMADSDEQYNCIVDTHFGLKHYYETNPHIYVSADTLIYYDPATDTWLPTPDEETESRKMLEMRLVAVEDQLGAEIDARQTAEARLAALEAELRRLRGE